MFIQLQDAHASEHSFMHSDVGATYHTTCIGLGSCCVSLCSASACWPARACCIQDNHARADHQAPVSLNPSVRHHVGLAPAGLRVNGASRAVHESLYSHADHQAPVSWNPSTRHHVGLALAGLRVHGASMANIDATIHVQTTRPQEVKRIAG
jgi:hypothetical protein